MVVVVVGVGGGQSVICYVSMGALILSGQVQIWGSKT